MVYCVREVLGNSLTILPFLLSLLFSTDRVKANPCRNMSYITCATAASAC